MALGTLDYLTVVTNPHGRAGRKRKAGKARAGRKRRTDAQRAATAKLLMRRGMSSRAARKSAGVRKGTRLSAKKRGNPKTKRRGNSRHESGWHELGWHRKTKRKTTTKRKATKRKTAKRRTTMARRKRRQTPKQRAASLRNLKKARAKRRGAKRKPAKRRKTAKRRKSTAKRKTTRRRKSTAKRRTTKRRGTSAAKRSAAARKGARTKAANKRRRSAAAKKGSRKRRRRAPSTRRRRASARTMRTIRSRKRTSRSKKRGLTSLRRTRRYLKGRRRSGSLTKAYAARHRMRTNRRRRKSTRRRSYRYTRRRSNQSAASLSVRGFTNMLPKFAAGLGGMLGTAFIGGYMAQYIPVGGAYNQIIVSTASVVATWFATDKIRFLKKYQLPILIGAGIGWSITFLRTFFPSFAMSLGLAPVGMPMGNGMEGYWAEGIAPIGPRGLSDYVRSGVLEGEYVPSGTPTLGAYVEEPLSGGLGMAYQQVAGMGIDVEEAIAGYGGMGAMNRPWGSLQMGGLGLDAVPVAQSGCRNCNMGSVMPMSAVPGNLPVNVRMAALQKAGQVTRNIAVRPPREMLGVQSCGIFGSTIWE